jgi:hypothetical protein
MNEAKKIDKPQGNGVLPCVSCSFCSECNDTGWKLRSNSKIPVEETLGIRPEIRFESLPISEPMIKCGCGRNYR